MSRQTYKMPRSHQIDNAIYGIANGEENSLRTLYQLTSSAVYAYALTVTKNVFDAQDVMQETFVKMYDAAPNYISRNRPMAWMLSIARNLCMDKFRSNSRLTDVTDEQLEAQLQTVQADVTDRLVVQSCLSKLSQQERTIVVMHAVGGVRHREIARQLDLPLNTVLSKYKRSLQKLKDILQGGKDE